MDRWYWPPVSCEKESVELEFPLSKYCQPFPESHLHPVEPPAKQPSLVGCNVLPIQLPLGNPNYAPPIPPIRGRIRQWPYQYYQPVSYTHLTLPTNREV